MVRSPIGEALIRLPPTVAILRMGVEETSLIYAAKLGKYCCITGDSLNSVTVAEEPMVHRFPSCDMPFNRSSSNRNLIAASCKTSCFCTYTSVPPPTHSVADGE